MFNFESAPLSLPTILGYLSPLSASFLVTVAAKLLIAGWGVYLCCRLLGTGPVAAAFAGTTFMLSGSFSGWLGWSVSGPIAWGGFILAGAIIAYRSSMRVRGVLLLAVSVAFSLYAGFPESYVLLAIGLGIVLLAGGVLTLIVAHRVDMLGVVRVGIGVVAGVLLAAPLLLPGVTLLSGSARNGKDAATGLPMHLATLLFAQGFFGLPIKGSYFFGAVNYYETAAYVGILALVLGGIAVLVAFRRPIVLALFAASVAAFLTIYQLGSGAPVQKFLSDAGLSAVALQRMQSVFELVFAVLAGVGFEIVVTRWRSGAVRTVATLGALGAAAVLAELWRKVSTARLLPTVNPVKNAPTVATLESLRRSSLYWPTATVVGLLLLVALAWIFRNAGDVRARRAGTIAAVGLLAAQSAFLLFAGVGINSYSHDAYPVTPAVANLQSIVGTKLVALDSNNTSCTLSVASGRPVPAHSGPFCGVRYWGGAGFYPEMNLPYGIDELGLHDPLIPQRYFDAWPIPNSDQVTPINLNLFDPDVDTVALARRYGVAYVLAVPGAKPQGMQLVATIAGEGLYSVPGSSRFAFVAGGAEVTSTTHPSDNVYDLDVKVTARSKLAIHLTDVTGWHASANGQSLALSRYDGAQLSAEVPAGTRTITLTYWPRRFTEGIAVALLAVLLLAAWAVAGSVIGRRPRRIVTLTGPTVLSSPPLGPADPAAPLPEATTGLGTEPDEQL
jgi:hypothetical protein